MNVVELVNPIIGHPWEPVPNPPESFNCGELIRWVYRKMWDIESPPIVADPNSLKQVCGNIRALHRYGDFSGVDTPRDLDVVKIIRGRSAVEHVGLYMEADGGLVLHCQKGGGVMADPVFNFTATGRALMFFRHREAPTWDR